VNLIQLRAHGARNTHVQARCTEKRDAPRIVAIDDYILDLRRQPRARRGGPLTVPDPVAWERSSRARRGPTGDAPLMVLSTSTSVPQAVVEQLRVQAGIVDALAIELD
jgi:hypothetical protein